MLPLSHMTFTVGMDAVNELNNFIVLVRDDTTLSNIGCTVKCLF